MSISNSPIDDLKTVLEISRIHGTDVSQTFSVAELEQLKV